MHANSSLPSAAFTQTTPSWSQFRNTIWHYVRLTSSLREDGKFFATLFPEQQIVDVVSALQLSEGAQRDNNWSAI